MTKSSNAGFTPRDLQRREFQTVAAQAIDRQAAAIQQTREFMADLSTRLDAVTLKATELECHFDDTGVIADLRYLAKEWMAFRAGQKTLWGRLRWLLTGR